MELKSSAPAGGGLRVPAIQEGDRTRVLIAVLLALFLAALDQTIVSTALPKIVEDLRGVDRYAWVATAYLLASTSLVPIYGKLADRYSRKTIELVAISLFLFGSFLCGVAGEFGSLPLVGDGMNQLVAFRAIQGMGGAGLFAMTFIIIADLYPPSIRGKYQGFVGAVFGIASILGPLAGGLLTDHGGGLVAGVEGWRWVFYVNVPFGALAVWFIVSRMPPLRPHPRSGRLDLLGAGTLVVALVLFVMAVQVTPGVHTLAMVAASTVLLGAFVHRSRRHPSPVLDLGLFDNPVFRRANIAGFFSGAAFLAVLIFLPLFLVNVLGVSATRAGVALIPLSMGVVFGATVAGQLVSRIGHYRWILTTGLAILAVGVAFLSQMTPTTGYGSVALLMVVCGTGIGPTFPLFTLAIQNAVPVSHLGQATSAAQFFRQIGGTVGAASMGAVMGVTLMSQLGPLAESKPGWAGWRGQPDVLAATGGSDVRGELARHFRTAATDLSQHLVGRSAEDRSRVVSDPTVPERVRRLVEGWEGPVSQERLASLEDEMDRAADDLTVEIRSAIQGTFALAIRRIYGATLVLVLIALTVVVRIPELALREEHDADVASE